ncbi:antitoxin MazE family protein [Pelagibacterium sediminicola]|uniref:antitoxin MazE family protein n=1 Tax=Pelagibacterium sediminicola TaxID=2248761 RepID=UPI000E314116|nr:antitoxin MazE family protein [Pelagibacterium sediminicola]
MSSSVRERVRKHREALRRAGMRPVQIWVPDTRQPGFRDECRRQSAIVAEADRADAGLMDFLDAAFADLDDRAE